MRGIFATFENKLQGVGGEAVLFVLSGEIECGGNKLCEGQGIICSAREATELFAEGRAEILLVELELASIGLAGESGKFEFSQPGLLRRVAECFFCDYAEYDNAMLEHGIAGVLRSFIAKKEQSIGTEYYIDQTERYIEENLHRNVKIEEIADSLSISRGYLRNVFYRHRGCSPQEYLMLRRMDRAKELLADASLSVTSVAAAVGYADVLGFSRMFKRHVGCSPSEYRSEIAMDRVDNAIKEKKPIVPVSVPAPQAKAESISEAESNAETLDDIAKLIEKAAAEAKAEQEKKEKGSSPPPFWLL